MHPLTSDQTEAIETALAGMRTAYNHFEVEPPCHFTGIPDDLSSLDYILHELSMPEEFTEGSVAFSVAWGHVLATSFGFSWVATNDRVGPDGFALRHENPDALIFPYYRLLEIEESPGCNSPAELLWFDTIRYFDHHSHVADGWHPVFDAVYCPEKLGCPPSLTKACQRLFDKMPTGGFYYSMSTYPYDLARDRQWDKLRDCVDQLADSFWFNKKR
jgi:hypothetical protein